MSGKLTREAYEQLIVKDLDWLHHAQIALDSPIPGADPEAEHIRATLKASVEHEYGSKDQAADRHIGQAIGQDLHLRTRAPKLLDAIENSPYGAQAGDELERLLLDARADEARVAANSYQADRVLEKVAERERSDEHIQKYLRLVRSMVEVAGSLSTTAAPPDHRWSLRLNTLLSLVEEGRQLLETGVPPPQPVITSATVPMRRSHFGVRRLFRRVRRLEEQHDKLRSNVEREVKVLRSRSQAAAELKAALERQVLHNITMHDAILNRIVKLEERQARSLTDEVRAQANGLDEILGEVRAHTADVKYPATPVRRAVGVPGGAPTFRVHECVSGFVAGYGDCRVRDVVEELGALVRFEPVADPLPIRCDKCNAPWRVVDGRGVPTCKCKDADGHQYGATSR